MQIQLSDTTFYTAKTLADELKVSRSMVYYLLEKGDIQSEKIAKSSYIILKEAVADYLQKKGHAVT
jgi:excisionase family DNA binding protein